MKSEKDIFDHIKAKKVEMPSADYFKNLTEAVLEKEQPKIIPMHKRPVVWIGAIAAAIVISLLVMNISNSTEIIEGDANPLLTLNDVSSDDLVSYIEDNIEDFDTDLIVEMIPENSLDEVEMFKEVELPFDDIAGIENINSNSSGSTMEIENLDDQDILDYFNEEGIDLEDFEDEDPFI